VKSLHCQPITEQYGEPVVQVQEHS